MGYDLERFLLAQQGYNQLAQYEIKKGFKRSHWIWFIFPQLKGLGHSYNSMYYGITDFDEARAYLEHPVLGKRLYEITRILLSHAAVKTANEIFGDDAVKVRSSMTLFDCVAPGDVFAEVLDAFFMGKRCEYTSGKFNSDVSQV